MQAWLKRIQMLAAAVIFAGGATLAAEPAAAYAADCNCYEQYEAISMQEAECMAQSNPPFSYECPFITSCWTDEWGHVHYTGGCFNNGTDPCPPTQPVDCQP